MTPAENIEALEKQAECLKRLIAGKKKDHDKYSHLTKQLTRVIASKLEFEIEAKVKEDIRKSTLRYKFTNFIARLFGFG